MKASLLLLVLTMGAATAAQATDCTPVPAMPTEGQSLAANDAANGDADSLSALDGMLGSQSPSHGSNDDADNAAPAGYADQPGPAMRDAGASTNASSSRKGDAAPEPSAASSSGRGSSYPGTPSGLGWQSLLPGSIQ